jgi:GNAT superfamily N-acetyltransferase
MASSRTAPLVAIRPYRPQDFDDTVRLWYDVGHAAHPYVSERYSYAEFVDDFRNVMSVGCAIWQAEVAEGLAGFIILRGDYVDQLYVAVSHQRRGIGGLLMTLRNGNARTFYEHLGFRAIDFGVSPEGEPEIRYRWIPAAR